MRRRSLRAVLVVALLALAPGDAAAHGLLRSSVPAGGATVASPPTELLLTFTETPEPRFTGVRLFGPRGEVPLDSLRMLPGMTVGASIAVPLIGGVYRVEWQTAGDDGHPVSGSFGFTVLDGVQPSLSGGTDSTTGLSPPQPGMPPGDGAHAGVMQSSQTPDPFASFAAILRWLTLMSAVAMIGAVVFRYTVLDRVSLEIDREIATDYLPDAARRTAMLGAAAASVLLLTGIGRLIVQSLAVHDRESALDIATLAPMVAQTNWGLAWMIQALGAVVALACFLVLRQMRARLWLVAALAAVTVAAGLALASHASVVPRLSGASLIANAVHTLAAAGWLGNLFLVFAVGLPLAWRLDRNDRWTVVRDIVNAFSPAALTFGGIAGATGVFMAWTHVGSIAAVMDTDYGNALLLKVGLLSLTALTGAYNWLRVRPSLGDHTGARRLRRTAGAELAIATLVLAVTAVLVALPLPQTP